MQSPTPFCAPEPRNFQTRRTCLFLGVDGTLVDVQKRPDEVRIDSGLLKLLDIIHTQLEGAVALISGRPLSELDRLFAPLKLPVAGVHGFERRGVQHKLYRPRLPRKKLDAARTQLERIAADHAGLIVEDKQAGLALHYRLAPDLAEFARQSILDCARALGPGFEVIRGDYVVELKPSALNKATAVEAFLDEDPFAGRIPIYLGDDGTDFDGFSAVRRNRGVDIVVGNRIPARWMLNDPTAVRGWLERFAAAGPQRRGSDDN